jgi:N-methylhydantoinase A
MDGQGAGSIPLDRPKARNAIAERIGAPLGLGAEAAAEAIVTVASAKMAGHVRRRLLEKGLDPRDFSMIAFGGAGPLHANRMVREIGLKSAVIPWFPGLTSALGCILGRLRHDFLRSLNLTLSNLDLGRLNAAYDEMLADGRRLLADEGVAEGIVAATIGADMCYRGQTHVIQVTFASGTALSPETIRAAFEATYRQRYSELLPGQEIRLVNARATLASTAPPPAIGPLIRVPEGSPPTPRRTTVVFQGARVAAEVWPRHELPRGFEVAGPAVLLQTDSTTFVEPGYRAQVHATGNILIERQP